MDTTSQRRLRAGDIPELALQSLDEFVEIVGASVGEFPLQQGPDRFVWIQVWSVTGEVLQVQPRVPSAEVPNGSSFVDAGVVEQCDDVPSKVAQHFA